MGYFQEAYDAAIARALAVAAERAKRRKLNRVRIFTDAQATTTRVTHGEPGLGRTYALQARKAIAALREREPSVESEDPLVPRAQRDLRERDCGWMGQAGRQRVGWPRGQSFNSLIRV